MCQRAQSVKCTAQSQSNINTENRRHGNAKSSTCNNNNYDLSINLAKTVWILSPNCIKILSNCQRAPFANSMHRPFSDTVNFCKKLAVRISIWLLAGRKPILTWHLFTTFDKPVWKSFMKIRVNVNSYDKVWQASNGHASKAYSNASSPIYWNGQA